MAKMNEIVVFESEPGSYWRQETGMRANMAVLIDAETIIDMGRKCLLIRGITIEIVNTISRESFRRKVTDVARMGEILENKLIIFSWHSDDKGEGL